MSPVLVLAFALGQPEPMSEKAVTDAEKAAFLKLLMTLPTRGEFFAQEAIDKAAPYTRVLLALTEKDLKKYNIYPFLAISAGLGGHKQARQYAIANFGRIAHPQIKLSWAIMLFRAREGPPELVPFLRKALDAEGERNFGLGPEFQDFRDAVIRVYEAGKLMKIEPVKRHSIDVFPEFGGGFSYTNSTYVFAPGPVIHAVRPLRKPQFGELIVYDLMSGKGNRRPIPQPKSFTPKFDFSSYFDDPVVRVNERGDVLCLWTLEGNGDHGVALLKRGGESFLVNRIAEYLSFARAVVPCPDGAWYLVRAETQGFFNVFHIDTKLRLQAEGNFRRRQSSSLSDAHFISNDMLHVLAMDHERGRSSSLRCLDFDVRRKTWLHNREMLRLEQSVTPARGTALQLKDGSLHYLWGIVAREGNADLKQKTEALHYRAEADATILKVGGGTDYAATAIGDRIIVCYSEEGSPNDVFLRVIRNGVLGPVARITLVKEREHSLSGHYMALHAEANRVWFVNTLEANTLYESKLADVNR
jgi:hypothetical protein